MALVPDTGFITRFPEFTAVAEARIQLFLDEALLEIRESDWGAFYNKGLNLYTAHLLTLGNQTSAAAGGAGGSLAPITSRAVGDVSISFANPATSGWDQAWLCSTSYGQEFYNLTSKLGCDLLVV